jgi:MFS family permease
MAGMAAISYPMSDNLFFWAALRVIGGFFVAGLYIVIESWFSAISTPQNRSSIFSFYLVATYSASALGQFSIGYGVALGTYIAFTLGGMMIFSSSIPLSISSRQSPSVDETGSMSPFRLARRALLGLVGSLCGGFLLGAFYGLIPLYGTMTEISSQDIGRLMSISVTTAMLMAWPIGWLADRLPRSSVMLGLTVISGVAALLVMLFGRHLPELLYICVPLIMGSSASIYSIAFAITHDLVDNHERIGASSTLLMVYGIGSILGPLVGSWVMQVFSPAALFACFIVVLALLAVITVYRQAVQAPIPVEYQDQFVPVIPEAQVNAELMPIEDEPQFKPADTDSQSLENESTENEGAVNESAENKSAEEQGPDKAV